MKRTIPEIFYLGISLSLCLSGCSKEPEVPTAKIQEKPLVEVIYDAAKFYADGGKTFTAPQGILIDTSEELKEGNRVSSTSTVRISGVQQKGKSVAIITLNFPGTWLTSEKQHLSGLENEMRELTACSHKLIEQSRSEENPKSGADGCRMKELIVNDLPAVAIKAVKASHVEMVVSAAR